MNVIIFGAAGGIGRHAVKHALAKGYQVTTYLRTNLFTCSAADTLIIVLKTLYRYGTGILSGRRITVRVVLPVFTAAPNRQFNMEEKQKKLGDIQILIYSGKQ